MKKLEADLIKAWQALADLTAPECRTCKIPFGCCAPEYCQMAAEHAKESWGIEPTPTEHPKLPFMGPTGCTLAPHLRPLCTLHTCEINSLGAKRNDPEWNQKYFSLREQIEEMEWKRKPIKKRPKNGCDGTGKQSAAGPVSRSVGIAGIATASNAPAS